MTDGERDLVGLGRLVREARGSEAAKPFARRAGVSPEVLWQIENARRRDRKDWAGPTAPILQAVARAAGIPEAEALRLAGYNPDHYITPVEDEAPLMSETALARVIGELPVNDRRALETLTNSLRQRRALEQKVDELLRKHAWIAADAPRPGSGAGDASAPIVVAHDPQPAPHGVGDLGDEFVPEERPARGRPDSQSA